MWVFSYTTWSHRAWVPHPTSRGLPRRKKKSLDGAVVGDFDGFWRRFRWVRVLLGSCERWFFPQVTFRARPAAPPQNNSDQLRSCNSLRSPGGELLTTLPQDLVARVAGWGWGRRLRCVRWSGDLVLTGHERSGCPWEVQLSYGRRWTTHKAKHGYPSPGWRATVLWTEQCLFWCASHASHWISGLPQEG